MEHSRSGYIEPMTRGSRANAARVQAVIHAISERFTAEHPDPSAPKPGDVGTVKLPHEYNHESYVVDL